MNHLFWATKQQLSILTNKLSCDSQWHLSTSVNSFPQKENNCFLHSYNNIERYWNIYRRKVLNLWDQVHMNINSVDIGISSGWWQAVSWLNTIRSCGWKSNSLIYVFFTVGLWVVILVISGLLCSYIYWIRLIIGENDVFLTKGKTYFIYVGMLVYCIALYVDATIDNSFVYSAVSSNKMARSLTITLTGINSAKFNSWKVKYQVENMNINNSVTSIRVIYNSAFGDFLWPIIFW